MAAVLLLNTAAATQDTAVDALAIEVLGATDLGWANTVQVVGFKGEVLGACHPPGTHRGAGGMLLGGGVLVPAGLWLGLQWNGMFVAVAAAVVACLGCALPLLPPDGRRRPADASGGAGSGALAGLRALWRLGRTPVLALAATYKLGEAMARLPPRALGGRHAHPRAG